MKPNCCMVVLNKQINNRTSVELESLQYVDRYTSVNEERRGRKERQRFVKEWIVKTPLLSMRLTHSTLETDSGLRMKKQWEAVKIAKDPYSIVQPKRRSTVDNW